MHYYKFHIGDYARDTSHLTVIEHGIYRLLLDWCYLNEKPITTERAMRVGRGYPEETQSVLSEFFSQTDDGWMHARVVAEVDHYHAQSEKNRKNGAKGGRKKSETNPVGSQSGSETNPNHKPLTINQEPRTKEKRSQPLATPDGVSDSVWNDFLAIRKAKKAPVTQAALDGIRSEADKVWWSLEDALKECCMRGWIGFKADWVKAEKQSTGNQLTTFAERDEMARRKRWEEMTGRKWPTDNTPSDFIDATPIERIA